MTDSTEDEHGASALELLPADIKARLLENGRLNAARLCELRLREPPRLRAAQSQPLFFECRGTSQGEDRENAKPIAADGNTIDFHPVVKLFTPDAGCTWLLTEIDPENPEIAFGLCDLGMGCPEIGSVSLAEIAALRGKLGLPTERDLHFEAAKSLAAYADEARLLGRIKA